MIQFVDGTFDSLYGHKVIDIKEKYIKKVYKPEEYFK